MERVVESRNLRAAYVRVQVDAGAPGIDGMSPGFSAHSYGFRPGRSAHLDSWLRRRLRLLLWRQWERKRLHAT